MSVAKVDVDIKMDQQLLSKFIKSRLAMLRSLNYTCRYYNYRQTAKGYHFWFIINEHISDKDLADLQLLLGDDQTRAKFNYIRVEAGVFKPFNALFSKKKRRKKKWRKLLAPIYVIIDKIMGKKI